MHRCHATGCGAEDAHPEVPFCKPHFAALPKPHQQKLWKGRRKDGVCGACDPREADEIRLRAIDNWYELFNLALAILLIVDHDGCGIPNHDEHTGFCWGCGVDQAEATYVTAEKIVKKYGLRQAA